MREQFSSKTSDPRVSIAEGTFDSTPVPDGWADLIVVGTKGSIVVFHWSNRQGSSSVPLVS